MKSFASGLSYLRQEALETGFIIESDNDDTLVERLSQVVRKLGREAARKCDALTQEGQETKEEKVEPGPNKRSKRKA